MTRKLILPILLLLCACTERIDLQSRSDYHDYLAVEATLTDRPEDPQRVILSRSISYFHNEPQPMVQGASVKVNDVIFNEKEAGIYEAPEGYACEKASSTSSGSASRTENNTRPKRRCRRPVSGWTRSITPTPAA